MVESTGIFYRDFVVPLERMFPGTTFHYISYGLVVPKLMAGLEDQSLADLQTLVVPSEYMDCTNGSSVRNFQYRAGPDCNYSEEETLAAFRGAVFTDNFGPTSFMATHIIGLLWVHELYEMDLDALQALFDPGFEGNDIRRILEEVVAENDAVRNP